MTSLYYWSEFINSVTAVIHRRTTQNEEAIVHAIAQTAIQLNRTDPDLESVRKTVTTPTDEPYISECVHRAPGLQISVIKLPQDGYIGLHDHPQMTGVILCLSGQLRVESYDLVDNVTGADHVMLRLISDAILLPGQVGTLTSQRGNIHRLTPDNSAVELIDIFHPGYTPARLAAASGYVIEEGSGNSLFRARRTN